MNRSLAKLRAGFTLSEIMVSVGVMLIAGSLVFAAVRTVTVLGVKNTAVNSTHQMSREVIHKAVQQIHSSVSIPALVDTSFNLVSGVGPAAGVMFQLYEAGPYRVWASAGTGSTSLRIAVAAGAPAPKVGQRLIVPTFAVEEDITAVASLGGTPTVYSVTLKNGTTRAITCTNGSPYYATYLTRRAALVVNGTDLRFYNNVNTNQFSIVAPVSSATPFTVPNGDNRFVRAVLDLRDSKSNNLNLAATETRLQLTVPYRCRLTTRQ